MATHRAFGQQLEGERWRHCCACHRAVSRIVHFPHRPVATSKKLSRGPVSAKPLHVQHQPTSSPSSALHHSNRLRHVPTPCPPTAAIRYGGVFLHLQEIWLGFQLFSAWSLPRQNDTRAKTSAARKLEPHACVQTAGQDEGEMTASSTFPCDQPRILDEFCIWQPETRHAS